MSDNIPPLTVRELFIQLKEVDDWYTFGVVLGVPVERLREIETSNNRGGVQRWKIDMLHFWLKSTPTASWEDIIRALKLTDHAVLAAKLRSEYIVGQQLSPGVELPDMGKEQHTAATVVATTVEGTTAEATTTKKQLEDFESQAPLPLPEEPVIIKLAERWTLRTENLLNELFQEKSSVLTKCKVKESVVVTYLAPRTEAEFLIARARKQLSFMRQVGVCELSVAGVTVFHEQSNISFTFEASLLEAVKNNDTQLLSFLLNLNIDPNVLHDTTSEFSTHASSLFVASHYGHCEAIRLLLDHKANVNILTGDGRTALMIASSHNHLYAVDLLVKAGANLEILDKDNNTALRYANNHNNYQIVELLLKSGANPNVVGNDGWSCLLIACCDNLHESVELLLKHGADPCHATRHGKTCLMMTCQYGHIEALTHILEVVPKEEINRQMEGGWSALSLAYSDPEVAKLLLKKGADPNLPFDDGWTTLMLACQKESHPKTVDVLLSHNADPDQGTTFGVTPYGLARRHNHYQIMEALRRAGAKPKPLLVTFVTSLISPNKPKPGYQRRKYKYVRALWETLRWGGREHVSQVKPMAKASKFSVSPMAKASKLKMD